MRKLVLASMLTLAFTLSAGASDGRAQDKTPRNPEGPIARVIRIVRHVITPVVNNWPTIPIP